MALKVVLLSKAMLVNSTHSKAELLGKAVDLTLITPVSWPYYVEEKESYSKNYSHIKIKTCFEGKNHFHFYRGLSHYLRELRPDIIHIDEEPYSIVTAQVLRIAKKYGAKTICFTWQNIYKKYPFPFKQLEHYVYNNIDAIIAGNREAITVLRQKGYSKMIEVIPQFGVDMSTFYPREENRRQQSGKFKLYLGYVGRIVEEKGLIIVLEALRKLPKVHFTIVGTGPLESKLKNKVMNWGLSAQISFAGGVSSLEVADVISSFDALILPSVTQANWKEQFGRVLPEAMACKVAVIGSNSGEIPHVIGDAGLVFKERNVAECKACIEKLLDKSTLEAYQDAGRSRALAFFTQESIVSQTLNVYNKIG
ncbi:glycosyltransferase [Pontibacter sp. 13R65]|uniref:glycosyltransferase n=1 Tax=Pontibacter sp. 13R65 TaxID=3127458 RepID=UPI00301D44FC